PRGAAAPQHRHLHAAHLVHRPAGGRRAGAARPAARRRADHRRTLAGGYRAAHCARLGEEQGRCGTAASRVGSKAMDVDLPEVVAEVSQAFERYEQALVTNVVATLDALFRHDDRTIRYGVAENLRSEEHT